MKRDWSSADLSSESSDAKDDTGSDGDYSPPSRAVEKRKIAVKKTPTVAAKKNQKDAAKRKQRTPKTPRTSKKATVAKATAKPSTKAKARKNIELASAIPVKTRLPACDLGAVEMLTFFPFHIQWPELGLRLYRNGWKDLSIAKAMLHARNKLDWSNDKAVEKRRGTNRHQVLSNGQYFFDDENFAPTRNVGYMTPVSTYDASNYAPRAGKKFAPSSLYHAKLIDIAKGVVYWPENQDCGKVTQAIRYAVQNKRDDLTTADIPQLVLQHGFQAPSDSLGSRWDQRAQIHSEARIELTGNYRVGKHFEQAYQDETDDATGDATEDGSEDESDEESDEETGDESED